MDHRLANPHGAPNLTMPPAAAPAVVVRRTRAHLHAPRHIADRIADCVVGGMGSWRFIIAQTVLVLGWIALNIIVLVRHFDPYPFILLNLLFSTQAAYASPLILMAGNRAASRDRARDDHEAEEVEMLFQINQQQLEILRLLHQRSAPGARAAPASSTSTKRTRR